MMCMTELIAVIQSLRHVRLFATPWIAAHQTSLSFTISRSLLKLMSIVTDLVYNYLLEKLGLCIHIHLVWGLRI